MKEDVDLCLASGMDGYVGKPIRLPELLAAASRAVGGAANHGCGRLLAGLGALESSSGKIACTAERHSRNQTPPERRRQP